METLFSLQQAWLQTEMRKQQLYSDEVSPSPTSNGHVTSSPSLDSTSSPDISSSISSTPIVSSPTECWLSAAASALNKQTQRPNGESFKDPVLQYINDLLMEEEMEDRVCMMQECTSYQATVKELSDILGNEESPVGHLQKDNRVSNSEGSASIGNSSIHDFDGVDPSTLSDASVLHPSGFRVSDASVLNSNGFRASDVSVHNSDGFRVSGICTDSGQFMGSNCGTCVNSEFDEIEEIVNQWINDGPEDSGPTVTSTAPPCCRQSVDVYSPESIISHAESMFSHQSTSSSDEIHSGLHKQYLKHSPAESVISHPSSNTFDELQNSGSCHEAFSEVPRKRTFVGGVYNGTMGNGICRSIIGIPDAASAGGVYNGMMGNRICQSIAGVSNAATSDGLNNGVKETGICRSIAGISDAVNPNGVYNRTKENGVCRSIAGISDAINENGNNHKLFLGSNVAEVVTANRVVEKPPKHLISETVQIPGKRTTYTAKAKRSALEVDSAVEGLKWSTNGSSNGNLDSKIDEVVSFVRNMNLNAEKCGQLLNDGKPFVSEKICVNSCRRQWKMTSCVDLKSLLVSCAQAVSSGNVAKAHEILQEIRKEASPYGDGQQRLAHYFSEGMVARLSGTGGRLYTAFTNNAPSAAKILKAHHLFVQVCPFTKVSHYFANKAIFEAAKGASKIHVIDYGILYGLQWPCLISALAQRKGGPPRLRITGIDFPQPGTKSAERVDMTGRRLAEFAKSCGVPFQYHAIASKWENVQPSSLNIKQDEVLIVNSIYRLRHLLDETVLASNPRKTVLSKIRSLKPKIFVQGVRNGNFNSPFFMSRFNEALSFFSSEFDMIDATTDNQNQERMMFEREVLGRDILNVISCEGPERIERPETYQQWQNRTHRAGFEQLPLDQVVVMEAHDIVKNFYDKNFSVNEDGKWMLLGWKGHALHALSLWKPT